RPTLPLREGRKIRSEAENFSGWGKADPWGWGKADPQICDSARPTPRFASQISALPQREGNRVSSLLLQPYRRGIRRERILQRTLRQSGAQRIRQSIVRAELRHRMVVPEILAHLLVAVRMV